MNSWHDSKGDGQRRFLDKRSVIRMVAPCPTYSRQERDAKKGVPVFRINPALEHFLAKWTPVRVEKMRQIKSLEHFPDSIEAENALSYENRSRFMILGRLDTKSS